MIVRGIILTRLASSGSLSLFGEFSGQGRPWLGSLREVYLWSLQQSEKKNPHATYLKELIQRATTKVKQLVDEEDMEHTGGFKQGFDVMRWIMEPETAPKESYLAKSDTSTHINDEHTKHQPSYNDTPPCQVRS